VTTLIATLAVTACDQSKPTSPISSSLDASPRFAKTPTPPSLVHGVNFLIKSSIDNTFCIQAESGTTDGRSITLQTCGIADNQRWAFTDSDDDTNFMLDSEAMCVDGHFRRGEEGIARTVHKCGFDGASRFTYTASGLIRDVKNDMCLSVPGAANNANVSLAVCDESKPGQLWLIEH
jgi:hypothetical protein